MEPIPCPFEKTLLSNRFGCSHATRYYIAERESGGCDDPDARARCLRLLGLLRDNARFTLRLRGPLGPLPHGMEMKVQYGGLLGLQQVVPEAAADPARVADIHALVSQAEAEFAGLEALPFNRIVPQVAAYEHRRARGR